MANILDSLFGAEYYLARFLIQRGLGILYLLSFIGVINQFLPLLGEQGFLPIPRFLKTANFWQAPSLFHFYYSDKFLLLIAWLGVGLALTAIFEPLLKLPAWAAAAIWAAMWLLYLSIVNVGQTFYAFGWESMLLEAGFLAIFLGSSKLAVPIFIIWLFRFFVFRVEFGAGLIKLRGDECWRNLTCMNYHHETQPMPNPLSWFFHNLPPAWHKVEVLGNFFFQLVAPFGLFLPQPIAAFSAGGIIFSQLYLVLSGNFSNLNWMTIILALSGFTNAQLGKILPLSIPTTLGTPVLFQGTTLAVAVILVIMAFWPIKNMLSRNQLMNASFNPFHIMNTYGAFGSVTKERYEIVIEGTDEAALTPQTKWREYEFKGKPGDIYRRPAQWAPYHLRLDWLMWFQAFNPPGYYNEWFVKFLEKLLEGDKKTLKLLRYNPFPDAPPKFIRAKYYLYKFTTPEERRKTGAWWKREFVAEYVPPISLRLFQK